MEDFFAKILEHVQQFDAIFIFQYQVLLCSTILVAFMKKSIFCLMATYIHVSLLFDGVFNSLFDNNFSRRNSSEFASDDQVGVPINLGLPSHQVSKSSFKYSRTENVDRWGSAPHFLDRKQGFGYIRIIVIWR